MNRTTVLRALIAIGLACPTMSARAQPCAPAARREEPSRPERERSEPSDNKAQRCRDRDARLAVAALFATGTTFAFDERIARWFRQPSVQGDEGRHDLVEALTVINEMPLTIGAVAAYGAGRIAGWNDVADIGAHLTTSLVITELVSGAVRVGLGRTRPRASPNDAFQFDPWSGFRNFDNRAFPSLHAAVAFATAASLDEEMRLRGTNARRYVAPLLYAAAAIPGFTRLYLDQHWASDIVAGSVVGFFIGQRFVRYAHQRRTRLDRILLVGQGEGASRTLLVVVSLAY